MSKNKKIIKEEIIMNNIPTICEKCKSELFVIPIEQISTPGMPVTGKKGFFCICPECNLYPKKLRKNGGE